MLPHRPQGVSRGGELTRLQAAVDLAAAGLEHLDVAGLGDGDHARALRVFLGSPPPLSSAPPIVEAERRDLLPAAAAKAPAQTRRLAEAMVEADSIATWSEYADSAWAAGTIDRMAAGFVAGPGAPVSAAAVAFGMFVVAPDTYYPEHWHKAKEVYLVVAGSMDFLGADGWRRLGPGEASVQEPDVVHALRTGPDPMLCFWSWCGELDSPQWALDEQGRPFQPPRRNW